MQDVNLASVDMNLLVVLHALLDEAHVGRAGKRVGLSQPATSHALARLRTLFDDPLLVKVGTVMVPTPRGEALRTPLAAFIGASQLLLRSEPFDPRSSRRTFRLMLPDVACHLIAPPLLSRVVRDAPDVRIDFVPWRGPALLDGRTLHSIDFLITSFDREFPGFECDSLYSDQDAVVARRSHPDLDRLRTREGFEAARHVAVIGAGETADEADRWLAKQGIKRSVAVSAPNYLIALNLAATTDLVAVLPRRFAQRLSFPGQVSLIEPPFDPGTDILKLFTPSRAMANADTQWLTGIIHDVANFVSEAD